MVLSPANAHPKLDHLRDLDLERARIGSKNDSTQRNPAAYPRALLSIEVLVSMRTGFPGLPNFWGSDQYELTGERADDNQYRDVYGHHRDEGIEHPCSAARTRAQDHGRDERASD